ncbi:hypothetical protein Tco_1073444 [Tanacetum coccineum]
MSTQQDINAIRAQRLANTHDPLALMANTQTPFHPDHSSLITYIQHPQPNNNFVSQPSFNTNSKQQPMKNNKDTSDPTTAMNMTLDRIAKALMLNKTIPTTNNQRSSSNPSITQIAQSGMNMSQDIQMLMVDDNVGNLFRQNAGQFAGNHSGKNAVQNVRKINKINVVPKIANQYRNRNAVTAPSKGNGNGINGNPIRCYNCRGKGHQQLHNAHEETERVNVTYTSKDTLQQASTSGTQYDNALVYDLDGSAEVSKDENCYDHDIFNMLTQEVEYTDLQTELNRTKQKLETCIIKKEKKYATLWNDWWIPTGRIFAMYGKLTASSNTENKSKKSVCDIASTSNPLEPSSKGFSNSASLLGRWIPTRRIFAICGKLTASSNIENQSKKSVGDNASNSNPLEPSSKGFPIPTSLLGRLSRLRKQHTSIYPIVVL